MTKWKGFWDDIQSMAPDNKKAAIAKGVLAGGTKPNIEKNKLRKEITLKELFELYMERYSKVEKKSWEYDHREINKFLSHWFNRKVSDISQFEIKTLHQKIHEQNGFYQANRMLERIRSMFNKAIEWGWARSIAKTARRTPVSCVLLRPYILSISLHRNM